MTIAMLLENTLHAARARMVATSHWRLSRRRVTR
jgi:hypothetical protein